MKALATLTAAALATAFGAPAIAEDREATKGEIKLAKLLEGRVAGEPVSCVRTFPSTRMSIIDGTAVVVRRGGVLYVNVPRNPEDLDDNDYMVTRTFGTQVCRTDPVQTYDRTGDHYTGNIMLGDFVPYRRASS